MIVSSDVEKGGIVLIDGVPHLVEHLSINVHLIAQRIEPLRDRVLALEDNEGLEYKPVFYQFSANSQNDIVREVEPLVPAL